MPKKYELIPVRQDPNKTDPVFRVRYLDIGLLGGFVESEDSLYT